MPPDSQDAILRLRPSGAMGHTAQGVCGGKVSSPEKWQPRQGEEVWGDQSPLQPTSSSQDQGQVQRRRQLQWKTERLDGTEPRRTQPGLRRRLLDEVYRRLRKAMEASLIRHELLRQLMADICQPIDARARAILAADVSGDSSFSLSDTCAEVEDEEDKDGVLSAYSSDRDVGSQHSVFSRLDEDDMRGATLLIDRLSQSSSQEKGPGSAAGMQQNGNCDGGHNRGEGQGKRTGRGSKGKGIGSGSSSSGSDTGSSSSSSGVKGSAYRGAGERGCVQHSLTQSLGTWSGNGEREGAGVESGTGLQHGRGLVSKGVPPSLSASPLVSLCFYQYLAEEYGKEEEEAAALLPLFSSLWSSEFASQIFALLLHRWLYLCLESHAMDMLRYCRASLNGADALFWIDLGSNGCRFLPLFDFFMYQVLLTTSRFARVPPLFQADMVRLVSRFIFLYHPDGGVLELLNSEGLEDVLLGSPVHLIVTEITNQLQQVKVEELLIQFLRGTEQLKGVELPLTTAIRLQVVLHSLTAAGGPLFPTRRVRRNARRALDSLFPVGRRFRYIISLCFRLLHPLFWPTSIITSAVARLYKVLAWLQQWLVWMMEPSYAPLSYIRRRQN